MKYLKAKSFTDFSKGTWQSVCFSLVPENSVKLGLNLDSDNKLGSLISRYGTTLIGSQIIDNKDILGLHNYRDSLGSNSKLFAIVSDGTNSDIYDVLTGTKSLEDDTHPLSSSISSSTSPSTSPSGSKSPSTSRSVSPSVSLSRSPSVSPSVSLSISPSVSPPNSYSPSISISKSPSTSPSVSPSVSPPNSYSVSVSSSRSPSISLSVSPSVSPSMSSYEGMKTRFLTYLNSCLRLNGIDKPKAFNGTSWISTGGVFDLDGIPQAAKYAIEFKDRVYVAGMTDYPDRIDISGIANSTSRTISWSNDNRYILFEQEDGGGGITGLSKVPGYVLVFKKRTMKRYDGSSAYPEDMVNQGAPSQEAITVAQGMCFFGNENGVWATTGGAPKKISTYTVDKIVKSCSDFQNMILGNDEEHVFISLPSCTINEETYTNIVLKYNILQNTWDIRQYPTLHRFYAKYVDSEEKVFTIFGDNDGNVQKFDIGNTDNGTPITYSMETQDWTFGLKIFQKGINRLGVLTENISKGSLMWRNTHNVEDWKSIGVVENEVEDFSGLSLKGNYFNFKLTETTDSGPAKIIGFDFPEGIVVYENAK